MKVRLEDDYKKCYTLEELEQAKKVIKFERETDDEKVTEWAKYAANEISKDWDCVVDNIIWAEAETRMNRNRGEYEAYGVGSGYMDVWIRGIAQGWKYFIVFGAYLSDIWQTGAIDYRDRMYVERYVKEE